MTEPNAAALADELDGIMERNAAFASAPVPMSLLDDAVDALRDKSPASPGEAELGQGEVLWLIERTYAKDKPAERREFWLGFATGDIQEDSFNVNHDVWTTDALQAARYPSQKIAQQLRYWHFHPEAPVEVCDHMFGCGVAPLATPPQAEQANLCPKCGNPLPRSFGAHSCEYGNSPAEARTEQAELRDLWKLEIVEKARSEGHAAGFAEARELVVEPLRVCCDAIVMIIRTRPESKDGNPPLNASLKAVIDAGRDALEKLQPAKG